MEKLHFRIQWREKRETYLPVLSFLLIPRRSHDRQHAQDTPMGISSLPRPGLFLAIL
jgi:hypothetical protein